MRAAARRPCGRGLQRGWAAVCRRRRRCLHQERSLGVVGKSTRSCGRASAGVGGSRPTVAPSTSPILSSAPQTNAHTQTCGPAPPRCGTRARRCAAAAARGAPLLRQRHCHCHCRSSKRPAGRAAAAAAVQQQQRQRRRLPTMRRRQRRFHQDLLLLPPLLPLMHLLLLHLLLILLTNQARCLLLSPVVSACAC